MTWFPEVIHHQPAASRMLVVFIMDEKMGTTAGRSSRVAIVSNTSPSHGARSSPSLMSEIHVTLDLSIQLGDNRRLLLRDNLRPTSHSKQGHSHQTAQYFPGKPYRTSPHNFLSKSYRPKRTKRKSHRLVMTSPPCDMHCRQKPCP